MAVIKRGSTWLDWVWSWGENIGWRRTHLGKKKFDMIPAGQGDLGIGRVAMSLVERVWRQVWVRPPRDHLGSAFRSVGFPMTRRMPCKSPSQQTFNHPFIPFTLIIGAALHAFPVRMISDHCVHQIEAKNKTTLQYPATHTRVEIAQCSQRKSNRVFIHSTKTLTIERTYRWESRGLRTTRLGDVVNRRTARRRLKPHIRSLRNPFERPIAGAEIEHGGPVVGVVLREGACCALGGLGRRGH